MGCVNQHQCDSVADPIELIIFCNNEWDNFAWSIAIFHLQIYIFISGEA